MHDAKRVVQEIHASGAIGIIRARVNTRLMRTVEALREGGLSCVEITMNTPGVLKGLEEASSAFPELVLGAGTVLDATQARAAISAGARFLVTPIMSPEVIETARAEGCPIISGAMTPTEIFAAWSAGADIVKVFPAEVLGPAFFKAMRGPLPEIALAPTGGISADTAGSYIRAGASAVCAGGWLVNDRSVMAEEYAQMSARARALCQAIQDARAEMGVA